MVQEFISRESRTDGKTRYRYNDRLLTIIMIAPKDKHRHNDNTYH